MRVRQNPLWAAASDMRAATILKCVVTVIKKKKERKRHAKSSIFTVTLRLTRPV